MKTRSDFETDKLAFNIKNQSRISSAGPDLKPHVKCCGRCNRTLELYYFNPSPENSNLKMPWCIRCQEELEAQKAARPQKVFTTEIKREY